MLNVATETACLPPFLPRSRQTGGDRHALRRLQDHPPQRRRGRLCAHKIAIAVTKAFIAVQGGQAAASARIRELVESITGQVTAALLRRTPNGGTFHIEDIQTRSNWR